MGIKQKRITHLRVPKRLLVKVVEPPAVPLTLIFTWVRGGRVEFDKMWVEYAGKKIPYYTKTVTTDAGRHERAIGSYPAGSDIKIGFGLLAFSDVKNLSVSVKAATTQSQLVPEPPDTQDIDQGALWPAPGDGKAFPYTVPLAI